jgi:CMP-N-acetylneuraminic acid synthetase
MKIVAFIPARAGSKGVPKKNIRLLNGKPLITYSIEAALATKEISDIVVTTDCQLVKEIAGKYPVTIVDRPYDLSKDDSTTDNVIEHAINELNLQKKYYPDIILLLQCTSPFRTSNHISQALNIFKSKDVKSVVSVIDVNDEHPARMYSINDRNFLSPLHKNEERLRRQDLSKLYRRNGAIYALLFEEFKKQKTLIPNNSAAYIMQVKDSINIDTEFDFLLAECLMRSYTL